MRKFFAGIIALALVLVFAGCSSALDEKNTVVLEEGGETGSVIIGLSSGNAGRKLDMSSIKKVSWKVESSDMAKMSGEATVVGQGKGSFSIENIPVGKNRIISIKSDVKGFEISEVVDINSGENEIPTINWVTSAKANVYKKLLENGKEISNFTSEQNRWLSNAVPLEKPAYLVNVDLIASDFETLKTGNTYQLNYGFVSFGASNAKGYVVCINDPSSESKTIDSDESDTYEIKGVAPGTWDYTVTDAAGQITTKSVTVQSDKRTTIDAIGNPLRGKLFIFVKADSAPKIWAWETTGSKVELSSKLGEDWNNRPVMSNATEVYMTNPTGWYMKDFTRAGSSGGEIAFKLGEGSEINSKKTGTFWYDGEKFYDTDPTANQLPDDTSLSDIKVNGTSIGASTTSYTVEANVSSVTVEAIATDSKATVSVSPRDAKITEGVNATFTITVTAQNGNEKKYMLTVRRKVANDTSIASVKVGNATASVSGTTYTAATTGSGDVLRATVSVTPTDSAAQVVCSPSSVSLQDGESTTVKITVTNGTKKSDYTLNVSYKKGGGEGEDFETEYYWTNKNGAVGVEKTISRFSDWSTEMIVAQGAANDDPRAFRGYHEKATDFYALFAAYDKTNLYLMVEMPSIDDRAIDSKDWQYALDENLGMGVAINTGKGTLGDGEMDKGITVWNDNKYYSITAKIDTLLMFHPAEYGTPGLFVTNADGKFSYDAPYCKGFKENGIETSKEIGLVSKQLYGRSDNYGLTKEEYLAKTDYVDMVTDPKKSNVSGYMYQITIPLAALGIDYNYLKSTGISVMTFSTFGTSMMDALPWCSSLIDVASEAYSKDDSTSKEKEDVDTYDVKLARVGHM